MLESSDEDDSANIAHCPSVVREVEQSKTSNKQNKFIFLIKSIPYLISVITGGLTTLSLYMLIVSLPAGSNKSNDRIPQSSITIQNLLSKDSKFSNKVTFLGQKSSNLALFTWNGYSLIAKLSSPQWLPFDINDFVTLSGIYQGKDSLGNLILKMNSFKK